MKNKWLYWCGLITLIFLCLPITAWAADNPVGVAYRGHIQDLGDYPRDGCWVDSPEMIGTVGQSKRIEGFEIKLTGTVPEWMELRYNVHVQNKGWLYDENDSADWPKNGAYAGTRGDSLRIEAVKIVLTDRDGKAVLGYSVQYRGHVQNIGDLPADKTQWLADGAQLGTVGSSLRLEALLVQVVKTGTDPVEPTAPQVYDRAGTYGPYQDNETISGDVTIAADGVVLQNLVIAGNLTISEAVGDGNVTLNNVTVKGDTFVRGGGIHSIKINGGKYSRIVLEKTASGAVRIVALNVDGIPIFISEAAAGETIILEGAFESVTVNAPNMTVTTQGATTTIGKMTVSEGAAGSTVTVAAGTTVSDLLLNGKAAVKGQGTVTKAAVNADGVSFEKAPGQQTVAPTVTVPPVTPPVTPPNPGGGGGGYTPPAPIAVTSVSLNKTALSLSVNTSENLIATVNPAGASNKMVIWFSRDATVATVGSDGRVTGINEGTTEIDAFTQDGGQTATCVVTVKDLFTSITGLTVPFHGDKPDGDIDATHQYTGAVTWREQGASADLQDMDHFDGAKTYVATITLSMIAPYTVADIENNCFMVAGATTTNDANSAVVTAVFAPVNQYRFDYNAGVITAYSGPGGEFVIPHTFKLTNNSQAITLTGIGYQAFYKKGLTGVTLPQTVKTIGTTAFGENDLTELVIPEGVTVISQSAFYGNNNLTTVTLPGGIQVGDHAFANDLITSITIGNNATISNVADTMGVHGAAFYTYYVNAVAGKPAQIAGHYVYNSVSDSWQIDNGLSFSGATITAYDKTRMPYAFIPAQNGATAITAITDGDRSNLTGVFSDSSLKTLTFASDSQLTTIGSLAFAKNQLASISLPVTVETIGYSAFFANSQLKNVTLSSGLKTIDDSAFQDCRLETLPLPNGLETIGVAAFAFNNLAGTLTIPASVTNINVGAFWNNTITTLVIEEAAGTPSTLMIQDSAFKAADATKNPITCITIPAGVMISANAATMGYYGANFKAAYTAGGAGIYNYDSGTATWIKEAITLGVTAPFNGVAPKTAISADAQGRFTGAVSWTETLTSTAVVDNFDGAKAYTATITLSPISPYSFPAGTTFSVAGADSVTTVIDTNGLTATVTANYAVKDRYQIDDDGVITAYSGPGGELVVPGTIDGKTVRGIGKSAFFANTSLTKVRLPDTIQSISEASFETCMNLQAINIPKALTLIPASCFSGCSQLETVTIPPEASLQAIGENAFYITNLKTIAIPATVTAIGNNAFKECSQLEAVTFTTDSTTDSQLKTIGETAFSACALTELSLPATVTAIGKEAFIANKMTKLTLNSSNGATLTIGMDAFRGSPQNSSQNPIIEITLPADVSLPALTPPDIATMGLYGTAFKSFYESTEVDGNNCAGGTFVYDAANGGWSKNP